jgi:NitT/TauT family transport system substrate-binding protein
MPFLDLLRPRPIAFALVACLATAGIAAAQGPGSPTAIRFSLDSKIEAQSAPFLVTVDKGYFKAEGLDVTIDPSAGSSETINRVASGSYDMGVADLDALIRHRDQQPNAPKAVFIVFNRAPFAIIARKSRGITTPKDLEGKKLGAPAADGALAALKIFAHVNGVNLSKVTVENVGLPVREPMLAAGQVDAIVAPAYSTYVDLKDRGVPINDIVVLLMADYGVNLYGSAIIVNPKFATEKPETVRAFLRAFLKGLRDTVRDPVSAVEAVLKRNDLKKEVEIERLRLAIKENILTDQVRAHGYGDVDAERLANAIDQLGLSNEFKVKPKPSDIFTPDFLPPAADRKIN